MNTAVAGTIGNEDESWDAFISYRRTDIAFARALQKALSAYAPPPTLPVPQRRLRVFRDEGDLTGSDYYKSIDRHINASRTLVVICSPAARQSEFVGDEIRRFAARHGGARIVTVLLAGIPNNEARLPEQAAERAFPDALLEAVQMPLAVNYHGFDATREKVDRGRWEGSWYTLLANLYDQSREQIEQRELVRRRRRRNILAAIAGAVSAGFAVLAAVAWWQKLAADDQRNVALRGLAKYLATATDRALPTRPQQALLLAVESVRATRDADGTVTVAARAALRRALAAASGTPLGGLGGAALEAQLSADARTIAVVEAQGSIGIWSALAPVAPPRRHALPTESDPMARPTIAGASPDGRWVALRRPASAGLLLWQVDGPKAQPSPFSERLSRDQPLAFSFDGRWFATSRGDAAVQLWPLDGAAANPLVLTGANERRDKNGVPRTAGPAAFDPAGRWFCASGADGATRLWSLGDPHAAPQVLDPPLRSTPHFSPDGHWLAGTAEGEMNTRRVVLWRLREGAWQPVQLPAEPEPAGDGGPGASGSNTIVGYRPDGRRLATHGGGAVRLWQLDAAVPVRIARIQGYLAALGHDGESLAVVQLGESRSTHSLLWRASDGQLSTLASFDAEVEQLATRPDDRQIAVLLKGGRVWLVDIANLKNPIVRPMTGADGPVSRIDYSADGRWLFGGPSWNERSVRVWSTDNPGADPVDWYGPPNRIELSFETGNGGGGLEPTGGLPDALAIDPQGRHVVVPGPRGSALLFNLAQPNQAPRVLGGHEHRVTAAVFGPRGAWVATADWNHAVRVWPLATAAAADGRGASAGGSTGWASGNAHASAAGAAPLRVPPMSFPPPAPRLLAALPGLRGGSSVSAIALSADGRWLATGGDGGRVVLRDLSTPAVTPRSIQGHSGWITRLAFDAASHRLLSADEGGTLRFEPLQGGPALQIEAHKDAVLGAAFVADGTYVATAGADAVVRVWPVKAQQPKPQNLLGPGHPVSSTAADAGGRWFAAASREDGLLRVWDLQAPQRPAQLYGPRGTPLALVALSPDGAWIAAYDGTGHIRLWRRGAPDAEPDLLPATLPGDRTGDPTALRFSADGRWLAVLTSGRLRLWRLQIDEQLALACRIAGRNLDDAVWRTHLDGLPYRLTCPGFGLPASWLEVARRVAVGGEIDRAAKLLATARTVVPDLRFEPQAQAVAMARDALLRDARRAARERGADAARALYAQAAALDPAAPLDAEAELRPVIEGAKLVAEAQTAADNGREADAVALYRRALAADPGLHLDAEAAARSRQGPRLLAQAHRLAKEGLLEEAVSLYQQALAAGIDGSFEPRREAATQRAHVLKDEAQQAGAKGDLDAATRLFQQAQALLPGIEPDPLAAARASVLDHHREQARRLWNEDRHAEAAAILRELRAWKPGTFSGHELNEYCWSSATAKRPVVLMDFCEAAVAAEPDNVGWRDSRGVARLFAGNRVGAIADFEAYLAWAPAHGQARENVQARERWVAALKRGAQPSNFAALEKLGQVPSRQ
jgi:WD40 repeat protein